MSTVKIAISIPEPLFLQAEAVAIDLKLSRSALYAQAMEEFLQRLENQHMREQIAYAFGDGEGSEGMQRLYAAQRSYRAFVEGEW